MVSTGVANGRIVSLVSYPHKFADSHRPTPGLSLTSPFLSLLEDPCPRNALPLKTPVCNWPQQHQHTCVGVCVPVCVCWCVLSHQPITKRDTAMIRTIDSALFLETRSHMPSWANQMRVRLEVAERGGVGKSGFRWRSLSNT